MKGYYKVIRLQELDRILTTATGVRVLERPSMGWLRSLREGLGLSLRSLANSIGVKAPTLQSFERNEVRGALTLGNLERVAEAMECRVVYLLVPKAPGQTFAGLGSHTSGERGLLEDAEHSMALEGQGVGNVEERLKHGVRRRQKP